MKQYLVEFTDRGARIHKDPETIKAKKHLPNVLLNPTLPKHSNPKYWVKNVDKIALSKEGQKILEEKNFEVKNEEDKGSSFEFLQSVLREDLNQCEERLNKKIAMLAIISALLSLGTIMLLVKPLL